MKAIREPFETREPFSHVHMDIAGPYETRTYADSLYVVTLVDHHTRYAIAHPTFSTPTATDCVRTISALFERFHTAPEVVHTDNGSQFVSLEFHQALTGFQSKHVRTPVQCSWANGRVERFHRTLNERLRCLLDSSIEIPFSMFQLAVKKTLTLYNTAVIQRVGTSPHDQVYTFPAWIYPSLRQYRRIDTDQTTHGVIPIEEDPKQTLTSSRIPRIGDYCLLRTQRVRKLDAPYTPCKILGRVSRQIFRTQVKKKIKNVHIRHLKALSPDAEALIQENLTIPDDDRPLRDLRRGGML